MEWLLPGPGHVTCSRAVTPAKPACQRWEWAFHCYQLAPCEARSIATSEVSFTRTCKARSTATSWLSAKPDPPLSSCSKCSQIVREVRVSMTEQWDKADLKLESENVRVVWASRSVVKVSLSELEWKPLCQSCGIELEGVMRVRVYASQHSNWIRNSWMYSIIHKLHYIIHVLQMHYSNNSVMLLVNYRCIMVGYPKQL